MLAAQDWIDLRSYQEDMRFILDTYVTARDSTVVSKLDDTPLVELLLDNASTTPIDQILGGITGDDNAKAEIIDANLISEIIRKMPMNQTQILVYISAMQRRRNKPTRSLPKNKSSWTHT